MGLDHGGWPSGYLGPAFLALNPSLPIRFEGETELKVGAHLLALPYPTCPLSIMADYLEKELKSHVPDSYVTSASY
jgi:hypothetical protein